MNPELRDLIFNEDDANEDECVCTCDDGSSDEHQCPYACEINDDEEKLCTCCNFCTNECRDNI